MGTRRGRVAEEAQAACVHWTEAVKWAEKEEEVVVEVMGVMCGM